MWQTTELAELLLSSFVGTGFAALAELLQSKRKLDIRTMFATFLFGGMFGLGIALCWWNYMRPEVPAGLVVGVSILAGLGGITFMQLVVRISGHIVLEPIRAFLKRCGIQTYESSTNGNSPTK